MGRSSSALAKLFSGSDPTDYVALNDSDQKDAASIKIKGFKNADKLMQLGSDVTLSIANEWLDPVSQSALKGVSRFFSQRVVINIKKPGNAEFVENTINHINEKSAAEQKILESKLEASKSNLNAKVGPLADLAGLAACAGEAREEVDIFSGSCCNRCCSDSVALKCSAAAEIDGFTCRLHTLVLATPGMIGCCVGGCLACCYTPFGGLTLLAEGAALATIGGVGGQVGTIGVIRTLGMYCLRKHGLFKDIDAHVALQQEKNRIESTRKNHVRDATALKNKMQAPTATRK